MSRVVTEQTPTPDREFVEYGVRRSVRGAS